MPYGDIDIQKEYQRAWYQRKKDEIKLKTAEYYRLYPNKLIRKKKKYNKKNKDRKNAYDRAYKLMVKEKEAASHLRLLFTVLPPQPA